MKGILILLLSVLAISSGLGINEEHVLGDAASVGRVERPVKKESAQLEDKPTEDLSIPPHLRTQVLCSL